MFQQMLAIEAKDLLANNADLVILDVRELYEHDEYNIPNSILIPLNELPRRIDEIAQYKETPVLVYCKAGIRSAMACKFMATQGFKQLINLADGILGWQG